MARDLHVGDLVALRNRIADASAPPGSDVGIVVEVRRSDCRVFYPPTKRSSWLAAEDLALLRVVAGEHSVPAKMSWLLRQVEAMECELSTLPDGIYRLDIVNSGTDLAQLDEIRRFLGADLVSLTIEPQGMGAIKTIIQFR